MVNGDVEFLRTMWPRLAERFRCHVPRNQFAVDVGEDTDSLMMLAEKPPMAEMAVERGLEGGSSRIGD